VRPELCLDRFSMSPQRTCEESKWRLPQIKRDLIRQPVTHSASSPYLLWAACLTTTHRAAVGWKAGRWFVPRGPPPVDGNKPSTKTFSKRNDGPVVNEDGSV